MSEKIHCPTCGLFAGFSDGKTGPQVDACLEPGKRDECKFSAAMCRKFDPVLRPTACGNSHSSGMGEDSGHGSFYTHGMTTEDQ